MLVAGLLAYRVRGLRVALHVRDVLT
jgi:hypothetical protein